MAEVVARGAALRANTAARVAAQTRLLLTMMMVNKVRGSGAKGDGAIGAAGKCPAPDTFHPRCATSRGALCSLPYHIPPLLDRLRRVAMAGEQGGQPPARELLDVPSSSSLGEAPPG